MIEFGPLDLYDDDLAQQWVDVVNEENAQRQGPDAQQTSVAEMREVAERGTDRRQTFAAWWHGRVVGTLQTITNLHDNLATGNLWLVVHPDHQRRGVGTALLGLAEQTLRELGCTRIHTHTNSDAADGEAPAAFCRHHGYRETLVDVRLDLDLPAVLPEAEVDPEYDVEVAVDELPEEWLADRAHLARRMSTDAPMGEIDLDEEEWDTDRVRRQWSSLGSTRGIEAVARHRTTGRLVGYTDLTVRPATPHLALQADTLVLREHRGHGLGQAMKVAEIAALTHELPQVTTLRTWNAQTNTHMLAVNKALGFYESGFTHEWAKDL
jgi:GNAT superfamily N-acetyltransferase